MTRDDSAERQLESSSDSAALGWFPRIVAAVVGAGLGGVGGLAVFSTDNQAGSAALLAIGAVFLLVAIQGTPLVRMGAGQNSIELARMRRRALQVVEDATSDNQSPDVARGMLEAASVIAPDLATTASNRAFVYEHQVQAALARALGRDDAPGLASVQADGGIDLVASTGKTYVGVVVKYMTRGQLPLGVVLELQKRSNVPTLVVTNAPLSGALQEHNREEPPLSAARPRVEAVTWNGPDDDDVLYRTIDRLRHEVDVAH